jgi:hypothetical protein
MRSLLIAAGLFATVLGWGQRSLPDRAQVERGLTSAAPAERLAAIRAAPYLGSFDIIDRLSPLLRDADASLRLPAAKAIELIHRVRMATLRRHATAESPAALVRQELDSLQHFISRESRELQLAPELMVRVANERDSQNPAVRARLILDLAAMTEEPDRDVPDLELGMSYCSIMPEHEVFTTLCEDNSELVLQILKTPGFNYRTAVLNALSSDPSPEVQKEILRASRDRYSSVRAAALYRLSACPGNEAAIIRASRDRSAEVRMAVAGSVSRTCPHRAREVLERLAKDRIEAVRGRARGELLELSRAPR